MKIVGTLAGKVALVAGATRGAGRAIACTLGEAGATVYCTGRSTRANRSNWNRKETIEETAEMVTSRGGVGIHAQVDHTDEQQVSALFQRITDDQDGQLDVLVNDMTGDAYQERERFEVHSYEAGLNVIRNGSLSHILTSRYCLPVMIRNHGGLIVEMTDGVDESVIRFGDNLYYELEKAVNIHFARTLARRVRDHGIAVVALSPGYMRSEEMLDRFGVTEDTWRDGIKKDRMFAYSETPFYTGKAVVALACDEKIMQRSGQALETGKIARRYGFTDIDGSQPVFV